MLNEKKQKACVDHFFELAGKLMEDGKWTDRMQEVLDDMTTGVSTPETALNALKTLAEK